MALAKHGAESSNLAIGIDLGTTYCCVAVAQPDGQIDIIPNDWAERTTPSYVYFGGQAVQVGTAARIHATTNPKQTIFDAKRLIGRKCTDKTVQQDMKLLPFVVREGPDSNCIIEVQQQSETRQYTPEQISAILLAKLKGYAETYLQQPITDAVITVPAYFNDSQRQATKDAGRIAGLNVLRIINEPTAAALAYGLQINHGAEGNNGQKNILIFDLGGGTFDVSLLQLQDTMYEVKATAGDTHLGGEDFDQRLMDFLASRFSKQTGLDLRTNETSLRRLRTCCEAAKRSLSYSANVSIEIDRLFNDVDFKTTIVREDLEALCDDYFMRCLLPVEQVLLDSGLAKEDVHEVVLVGGSTRIPRIQQLLREFFNGKLLCNTIDPDEAVAYGAAVHAASLTGQCKNQQERHRDILLVDVTPLSLGIEVRGGQMSVLIPRNTTIPASKQQIYTTVIDKQDYLKVQVFEGERPLTKDNNLLGVFTLNDLPPMPKGQLKVHVRFELDVNGILQISAEEQLHGLRSTMVIVNDKGRLSTREIDQMLRDAEARREEDMHLEAKLRAREALYNYLTVVENQLLKQSTSLASCAASELPLARQQLDHVSSWLSAQSDSLFDVSVYEHEQQLLEDACRPLISKLLQNDGDMSSFVKLQVQEALFQRHQALRAEGHMRIIVDGVSTELM